MHVMSQTIQTMINSTPGYSIEILKKDLNLDGNGNENIKEDPWFNMKQAIAHTGKSYATIYRAIASKNLKTNKKKKRHGEKYSLRRSWLDKWVSNGAPTS